jgi:hypothetical protein
VIGDEGMDIFYDFNTEVGDIQYEKLVEDFERYFGGRENKTILRHRFLTLTQGEGETLNDFTTRATRSGRQCQLGGLLGDMTIHVIIKGLRNEKLKSELLQIADIDMGRLTVICAKYESAERTLVEFGRREEIEVAGVLGAAGGRDCTTCGKPGHTLRNCAQTKCYRCLGKGHVAEDCGNPTKCRNCGKEGHKANMCWQNRGRGQSRGMGRGGYDSRQVAYYQQGKGGEQEGRDVEGLKALHCQGNGSSDESL